MNCGQSSWSYANIHHSSSTAAWARHNAKLFGKSVANSPTPFGTTGLTKLNQDIVVPRSRLEDLFQFAARLQKKHRMPIACFGHAGDGNIHSNVMVDMTQPGARQRSEAALDELFRQVLAWGGSITGEHGIGLAKKRWWPLAASAELRALHKHVKRALDPKGILNPGKFI
jgi:glycolate oxidase